MFLPTIVNPKKLETGLRTISAGIPYTLLLRIEAIGFPTFGLLLYVTECEECCISLPTPGSSPRLRCLKVEPVTLKLLDLNS